MRGIDLSYHNGNVDFNAVKRSGIEFVILRAGYGREVSQKDKKFEEYYAAARSVGLPVGAYWYSYADSVEDARKEAAACLACIAGKSFQFPIYYDLEDKSQNRFGKQIITDFAVAFCEQIEAAGYWAGIYANTNWWINKIDQGQTNRFTRWLADYRSVPDSSIPRDMHQYTSSGTVGGISGHVDMNNCTRDFPSEIGGNTPAPVAPSGTWITCTANGVNVRAEAHTGSAVVEHLNAGNGMDWYSDDGWGWSNVKVRDTVGWVANVYLDKAGLSPYKVGYSTGDHVNVRSAPSTSSSVLRQVNKGNQFTVICILPSGWVHVDVAGTVGYISREYVAIQ